MLNRRAFRFAGLFVLTIGSLPVLAQEFSAEMAHLKPQGAVPARVRVKGDKMRFETASAGTRAIVIVDLKEQNGFMALPDSKRYSLLQPGRIATAMPFFHPTNPEDACAAWEKAVNKPGTCTKIGNETINGREAVKYKGTARNGDTGSLWVDRKLSFVVKWDGKAAASELRNIKEGPQSAVLFEIPKGYDRMDSRAARQQAAKQKAK